MMATTVETVTLSVDGREVTVPSGTSILEAARAAGIDIPNLCAYPTLKPFGRCRLCLVEVEGLRGFPSACTTPVSAGMRVTTESPRLHELRVAALELVLTEHPTGCLMCGHADECLDHHGCHARRSGVVTGCRFCPKDQQCELQDMVERLGVHDMTLPVRYRGLSVDRRDPFFDRDYNLCILCARCVRVCDEVRGAGAVALTFRGSEALVGTAYNRRLLETECQFCGACVDVCPTASLAERVNKWVGTPDRMVETTCPYCALGCPIELRIREDQLIGVRPVNDQPLCSKGRFAAVEHVLPAGRLLEPMIRRDGRLVPATWEQALTRAAHAFRDADRTAVYASADLTCEELAAIRALAEQVLCTRHFTCDAVYDGPVLQATATLDELRAADYIVTVRTDLRYAATPVLLAIQQAVAAGARLVAIEPFAGDLDRLAAVRPKVLPGGEHAALKALADDPALAAARRPVFVWGSALTAQEGGVGAVGQISSLASQHGAGLLPLLERCNSRGAAELGLAQGDASLVLFSLEGDPITPEVLVSFGRPPLARRPADFWIAHVDALDEVTEQADVVLPATLFAEIDGSYLDVFGRSRPVAAAVPPPGEARPADWVCRQLAELLGIERLDCALDRMAQPLPDGGSKEQMPAPPPGPGLLVAREFSRFSHRGLPLAERVPGFIPLAGDRTLRLHPRDAARLELRGGDAVVLESQRGSASATVRIDRGAPEGVGRLTVPLADGTGTSAPLVLLGPNPGRFNVRRLEAGESLEGLVVEGLVQHV